MTLGTVFVISHLIGLVFGLGSATVGDVLFFRALRNRQFSEDEVDNLHTIGLLTWIGLSILILSGIGLVWWKFATIADYTIPAKLAAKLTIVVIIALNGLFIHRLTIPLLRQSIGKSLEKTVFFQSSRLIFASGALSLTSWWSAFLLGGLRKIEFSYLEWLAIYGAVLAIAIIASQLIHHRLFRFETASSKS